ncbi:acetyltransferase [Gordonia jinghuaiqii]|uniref:Acetyltransferase n=2 Tax=Gordonia jinghuaiqii TaxID=2758710 RepID=A0A7D7LY17_9ACTN|nr:acetyltransferase [Gordonia jinghuaiqii]QMT02598.1 acetyltransferase [Gordonia jinghuaiqii]
MANVLAQLSSLAWPFVMRAIRLVFVPNAVRLAVLRAWGAQIERGVLMRPRVTVTWPGRLVIGADSWIGEAVTLDNAGPIRIGADVVVSQSATLRSPAGTGELVVDDGAWITLRATVTGPVTIGRGAVVGAAAEVRGDVAPRTVVVSTTVIPDASDPDNI